MIEVVLEDPDIGRVVAIWKKMRCRPLGRELLISHGPTPDTRLSISSGRVLGVTHSEVADMVVTD